MSTVRIKLIGAGGYGGIGLIDLVMRHPQAEISALVDVAGAGQPISAMWPHLKGACDMVIVSPDDPAAQADCDVVVFATPDRVSQAHAAAEVAKGRKVLDFSGDFRSPDEATYAEYARRIDLEQKHLAPELLPQSAYGIPELYRKQIADARVVGNPGCFAMCSILGLTPAVREGLVDTGRIIIDAKTGISGAGKNPKPPFHYPEAYDSAFAYRLSGHQHVMEMETMLGREGSESVSLTFTPQVVPMARGILSSLYAPLAEGVTQEKVLAAYQAAYKGEPFVKVFGDGGPASTNPVRGSNRCFLSVACDERAGTFRVISAIDNLMKGQAANALQNINVMFNLPETAGLDAPGMHP